LRNRPETGNKMRRCGCVSIGAGGSERLQTSIENINAASIPNDGETLATARRFRSAMAEPTENQVVRPAWSSRSRCYRIW